jgi:hypothetical protein
MQLEWPLKSFLSLKQDKTLAEYQSRHYDEPKN